MNAASQPRGFIVAVRPRGSKEPYVEAFPGAVFATVKAARHVAARRRANQPNLSVKVMPEGALNE